MAEDEEPENTEVKKGGSLVLPAIAVSSILGSVVFALVLSGTIAPPSGTQEPPEEEEIVATDDELNLEFIRLEPLMISLGGDAAGQNLRFEGFLEVPSSETENVTTLMPRVMDALNTYLRAVEYQDISEPSALLKIRLQMLKRVQFVVGDDAVTDLLVSKFLVT